MTRKTIEIVACAIAFGLLLILLQARHAQKQQESQLNGELEAQQKLITEATSRETQREQNLKNALREITQLKERTRTPLQVLKELPKYLPLPEPIVVSRFPAEQIQQKTGAQSSDDTETRTAPNAGAPIQGTKRPNVELPTQDLNSLFNFVQDCRACDAKLRTADDNAVDESAKVTALTRQRDLAVSSAKGGTLWNRLRRNLRWLAVGAAIGFLAAHRRD